MPVSLGAVAADVTTMLNAVGDPRWNSGEIANAVLAADGLVCAAIFQNPNNARNRTFLATQLDVQNGDLLSGQIVGPIESVLFTKTGVNDNEIGFGAGVPWDPAEIWRESLSSGAGGAVRRYEPHYFIDPAKRIFHNAFGVGAGFQPPDHLTVDVMFPTFTASSACQAPSEYTWIVFVGAMALMVAVEGENAAPQSNWAGDFRGGIQLILTGAGNAPPPQA